MRTPAIWQLSILTSALAGAAPGAAEGMMMRSPLWTGITQMVMACRLDADAGIGQPPSSTDLDGALDSAKFCTIARLQAQRGAPMPVTLLAEGAPTPALRNLAVLTLHLHRAGAGAALSASVARSLEIDESESGFVVPPVPVASEGGEAAVDAAIARALDRALPWRRAQRASAPPVGRQY